MTAQMPFLRPVPRSSVRWQGGEALLAIGNRKGTNRANTHEVTANFMFFDRDILVLPSKRVLPKMPGPTLFPIRQHSLLLQPHLSVTKGW